MSHRLYGLFFFVLTFVLPSAAQIDTARGDVLFQANCATCHGAEAHGAAGPDLTAAQLRHAKTDEELFTVIRKGIAGSPMTGSNLTDDEIRGIVGFLLAARNPIDQPVSGDPQRGANLFQGSTGCSACHMIDGQGGRLGPGLSQVSPSVTFQDIVTAIREPSRTWPAETVRVWGAGKVGRYRTVTVIRQNGSQISGVRLNEDTFTIQLMDKDETLHLLSKDDLVKIVNESLSLMPAYDEATLSESDLRDIAAFLLSRRSQ